MKKTKETRIKNEVKRLTELFEDCDANKLAVVKSIIERCAFITISLQDLEEVIAEEGYIEQYQNGENQYCMKKSASADMHISLTKNLNSLTKQLLEIVPPAQRKSKLSELLK